jgi:hypothetical protein
MTSAAVDLRHDAPGTSGDGGQRRHDRNPAVVRPLDDAGDPAGGPQPHFAGAMARPSEIEHTVAVAPHQQHLQRRTQRRPDLEQRVQTDFRVDPDEDQPQKPPALVLDRDGQVEVGLAVSAPSVRFR